MVSNVLLPLALNDREQAGVDQALMICQKYAAKITLLHVIELIDGATYDELREFYQGLEQRSAEALKTIASRFSALDIPVQVEICLGKRVSEILRVLKEGKFDLLVLPSHRVGETEDSRGWGTVSYQAAMLSPVSTLLIKP